VVTMVFIYFGHHHWSLRLCPYVLGFSVQTAGHLKVITVTVSRIYESANNLGSLIQCYKMELAGTDSLM
jgi:hypothetical protein